MNDKTKIVIVGGGASGLFTAILLARKGLNVTIIEKNKSLGRKLSATGNGRCNFTNEKMGEEFYFSEEKEIVKNILNSFDNKDVVAYFHELGILSRRKDGYVYPYSNQASTVVERFAEYCYRYGVDIKLEETVEKINKTEKGFQIETSSEILTCDKLVLACGGLASRELGGSSLGYRLAKQCKHSVTPLFPALTGFISKGKWISRFAGVRIQGKLTVFADGEWLGEESGEIQCSKQGISGIPAFQLCHLVAKALYEKREVYGKIDFLPIMDEEDLCVLLKEQSQNFRIEQVLKGFVNTKCIKDILERGRDRKQVANTIKNFEFPILDTAGFEKAQVTAGGVPLSEIDENTMESKKTKGLFLLGELLDVDGICGGYNLQWAFSTAWLCGNALSSGENVGGQNDSN